MKPISDFATLLRTLTPMRHPGTYVFASVQEERGLPLGVVVASMRESEGLSVVLEESAAIQAGLTPAFRCAWITLGVESDLHAVGLTAAFSRALADAGVSCNVIAGIHHDHIFVPVEQASVAMRALLAMQAESAS